MQNARLPLSVLLKSSFTSHVNTSNFGDNDEDANPKKFGFIITYDANPIFSSAPSIFRTSLIEKFEVFMDLNFSPSLVINKTQTLSDNFFRYIYSELNRKLLLNVGLSKSANERSTLDKSTR